MEGRLAWDPAPTHTLLCGTAWGPQLLEPSTGHRTTKAWVRLGRTVFLCRQSSSC